jgi:hypothetical protein
VVAIDFPVERSLLIDPHFFERVAGIAEALASSEMELSLRSRAGHQREALAVRAEAARLDLLVPPLSNGRAVARSVRAFADTNALTSGCLQRAPASLPCHLFHIMTA